LGVREAGESNNGGQKREGGKAAGGSDQDWPTQVKKAKPGEGE